jgi:hypothetical protein
VLDFGAPCSRLDRGLTHPIHHGERMHESLAGERTALMTEAGLAEARVCESIRTVLGRLSSFEAKRA